CRPNSAIPSTSPTGSSPTDPPRRSATSPRPPRNPRSPTPGKTATTVWRQVLGPGVGPLGDEDHLLCFRTRVAPTPSGGSAVTFPTSTPPAHPNDRSPSQHASLLRELDNLERRFRVSSDGDPTASWQPNRKEAADG